MISSHVVIISPMAEAGPLGARQLRVVLGADGRGGWGEPAGRRPGAQRHGTGCQVDPVGPKEGPLLGWFRWCGIQLWPFISYKYL